MSETQNTQTETIEICTDCLQYAAGITEDERGEEYSTQYPPLALVYTGGPIYLDTVEDEPHFSGDDCQGCGETLAGDRYRAEVVTL